MKSKFSDFDNIFNGRPVFKQVSILNDFIIKTINLNISKICDNNTSDPETVFAQIIEFLINFGVVIDDVDLENDDDNSIILLIDNIENYIYFEFSFEQNDDGTYKCEVNFEKIE